jgi:broad specificity phosphatase PhoE
VTTTFFLIRHGTHSLLGKTLAGRMANVHIDSNGSRQAQRLAERLAGERLDLISVSPMDRAQETAAPIARATGAPLETAEAINEIDIGEWTGRAFDEVASDPRWRVWNEARGSARAPGGESMKEVQQRALAHLETLRARLPEGRAAIISHGDVVRPILLHHLGMPLDSIHRIEVDPGSLSTLVVGDWGAKILSVNEVPR